MRKLIVQLTTAAFAWGCALAANVLTPASQAATLEWRFIGLNAVRENKDLVTWREITGLPEFTGFNSNLVQRVAATLAKPLAGGGENEAEISKLLAPIAEDLIAYPSIYELTAEGATHTWTLAIQIPATHQDVWKNKWDAISKKGKTEGVKLGREGNWTVLGNGATKGVLEKAKNPTTDVLQISGDALLLKKLAPELKPKRTELKVTVRGKGLRTEGKATFEQDLPFKLTPWQVPTNTIREPLVGFTAIQGIQDRLAKLEAFKKHPAPNQLFIWNERVSLFSIFAAAKVDDASKFVSDFTLGLNADEFGKKYFGNLEFNTNTSRLSLLGLPIAIPFLAPAHSNDVNFVYAGMMPVLGWAPKPIPGDLVREVTSRDNLVYYDWELGWARLAQIKPLSQILGIATLKTISNMNDPANAWLTAAEPKFGNTITEVSKTGPRELSLVRSSDSGFSALELFAMVQWVAGPESAKPAAGRNRTPSAIPALPTVKP